MTLVHHWSHPTTPAGTGWDIVIAGSVQLATEKGFSARAALGEADVIRVIVDDPGGTYDFVVGHRWYMVETAAPAGNQLVWNGYIGDQSISRGAGSDTMFPFGAGRRWELQLVQENTILGFRVIRGGGDRKAETAAVRLTWLLGSPYLSTVKDHGLIDWTGLAAVNMDPNNYVGGTASDVLRDVALLSGFNFYARYHEPSGEIELAFYEPNTSLLDASTLRISNDPADFDFATTWPAGMETTIARKGDRVAAGVFVPGSGKISSYGTDLTTSYRFGFRDMVAPSATVKTQAAANALRDRLLAQHNEQDERIENCRIVLPAAQLNDVKPGQSVSMKLRHAPGWSTFRPCRVVSKSFGRPDNQTQGSYVVDLELSPKLISSTMLLAFLSITRSGDPASLAAIPPGWTQINPNGSSIYNGGAASNTDTYVFWKAGLSNETGMSWTWNSSQPARLMLIRFGNVIAFESLTSLSEQGNWPTVSSPPFGGSVSVPTATPKSVICNLWSDCIVFNACTLTSGQTLIQVSNPPYGINQTEMMADYSIQTTAGAHVQTASAGCQTNGNWSVASVALRATVGAALLYAGYFEGLAPTITVSL